MVTQLGPIWPILGERAALQSTMRRCYKRLQEISLIPNLYPLFPSPHSYESYTREYTKEALDPSNDVISLPKVITMFIPTLETLLTKILNPQVPLFVNPRPLTSALFKKSTETTKILVTAVQNRVTILSNRATIVSKQPLWPVPFRETWWGSCWIGSRFPSQEPTSLPTQSCHGACVTISGFPSITIWSQYTTTFIITVWMRFGIDQNVTWYCFI